MAFIFDKVLCTSYIKINQCIYNDFTKTHEQDVNEHNNYNSTYTRKLRNWLCAAIKI